MTSLLKQFSFLVVSVFVFIYLYQSLFKHFVCIRSLLKSYTWCLQFVPVPTPYLCHLVSFFIFFIFSLPQHERLQVQSPLYLFQCSGFQGAGSGFRVQDFVSMI
ncbi:hypothetical protein T484DRAFT_2932435 [Baffinella frigidus]|nr:hypothetical protein T484DRAFT_2932435 [Cryptophyta sp. CCMP2293]